MPGKQLADVSDDDTKTWREKQIMEKNKNNQGKEFDYGTACVSCTKGNNWSKKKYL